MPDHEPREIFIIKRHSGHEEAHYGGAWKIAFADFMTAMMALFLVLWLISSTSEKTKHTVAQYFNPVKLVDMTTLKKGFRDPKETEMGSGPNVKESPSESESSQRKPSAGTKEDVTSQAGAKAPAHTEAALFRDPYSVLAEIAAGAPAQTLKSSAGAVPSAAPGDPAGAFSDPFTTTPHEPEKPLAGLLPLAQGKDADVHGAADVRGSPEAADNDAPSPAPGSQSNLQIKESAGAERTPEAPHSSAVEAARLKSGILRALNNGPHMQNLPRIEVQDTAEGILISLTDDANYSMFAVGSAEPQAETVQVMEKVGQILKAGSGSIVIRGHTDGRPYRSAIYDNWRLSSARAQMALYMLARGGLSEKRIDKVEGYADHHLKSANNPNASENRRIEILLRRDKP